MAYTKEQIEKAKAAASVDELIALAKEEEIALSEEKAKAIFAELHAEEAELSDVELDNVAGGGCPNDTVSMPCPNCSTANDVIIGNKNYCTNCGALISDEQKSIVNAI